MTKVSTTVKLAVEVHLILNEDEAAALDALAGYGVEEFLKVFYAKLGQTYLKPHEQGLRSLFVAIRQQIPSVLLEVKQSRKFFDEVTASRES